jgi:NADP-reducing hydrogenase subunit HndC
VEEHLIQGTRRHQDLLAPPKQLTGQIGSLRAHKGYNPSEQRIVLERAGRIDPENIEDAIAQMAMKRLEKY